MKLLAMSGAWVAGIYLASHAYPGGAALALCALSALLLAVWLRLGRRSAMPAVLAALLFLGMFRAGAGLEEPLPASYQGAGAVVARGLVIDDSEHAGTAFRFPVRVESLSHAGEPQEASGDLLVIARPSPELAASRDRPYFRYGDLVELEGVLDGSMMAFPDVTLLGEDRGHVFTRTLHRIRLNLADSLAENVPEPEASLGQALLLGLRGGLPEEVAEDFRATGTAHLLAISGLHVSVVLALALGLSAWLLGRRRHLYLALPLLMLWLYALLSGMSPSVVRAAIMGSVYLAALFFGRPRSVLPALGFAAALMAAVTPGVLWSLSFQLSFAAMAGIALMADSIADRLRRLYGEQSRRGSWTAPLLDGAAHSAAMTLAATAATLPLIMLNFERVSLVGLPTTLAALPAVPIALVTSALAGLAGLAGGAVAEPFGWLAWLALSYVISVVGAVSRLPGASLDTGPVAPLLVWAYYAVLAAAAIRSAARPVPEAGLDEPRGAVGALRGRASALPWALAAAVAAASLVWLAAATGPDGRLHVSFIDVGQGDAVLIETPGGRRVVVDGGPEPLDLVRFLGGRVPFMDRTVDVVALTHAHSDHVNGLIEVIRRYDVETILEREVDHDGAPYLAWREAVRLEDAEVVPAYPGTVVWLDSGVSIEVLGPPEDLPSSAAVGLNDASVVLRLVYGEVSFLLTGDSSSEAEGVLVDRGAALDSDVLKVAHHGSRTSSSRAFLEAVSPAAAVISVGEGNRFGHPHPEALAALSAHVPAERLFLTSRHGTVEVVTDGQTLRVETER